MPKRSRSQDFSCVCVCVCVCVCGVGGGGGRGDGGEVRTLKNQIGYVGMIRHAKTQRLIIKVIKYSKYSLLYEEADI